MEKTPAFRSLADNVPPIADELNGPPSGHCRYCLRLPSREHARLRTGEKRDTTMNGPAGYTQGPQRRYNNEDLVNVLRTAVLLSGKPGARLGLLILWSQSLRKSSYIFIYKWTIVHEHGGTRVPHNAVATIRQRALNSQSKIPNSRQTPR